MILTVHILLRICVLFLFCFATGQLGILLGGAREKYSHLADGKLHVWDASKIGTEQRCVCGVSILVVVLIYENLVL